MTDEQGQILVRRARQTIEAALGLTAPPSAATEAWLLCPGATFVTLTKQNTLRGCIGTLETHRPLAVDLEDNARAAAFRDPRFLPVSIREVPGLRVEVSLLAEPEPLGFTGEKDALASLRPGTDGLILEAGHHRATFLPQVWDQLPDRAEFLAHLKVKAGLPQNHWGPEVRLFRYTVEHWQEPAR